MSSVQMLLALLAGLVLGLLVALAASRLLSRRTARQLADSEARLRASVQEFASAALRQPKPARPRVGRSGPTSVPARCGG